MPWDAHARPRRRRAALAQRLASRRWKNAAINAENLSELPLTLGDTVAALKQAQQGAELADQSGERDERMDNRTVLANILLQSGRMPEAEDAFREAESIQKQHQPTYPILYSLQGFHFCDLLLDLGGHAKVTERATQTLAWVTQQNWLLDIALDHLCLDRAAVMRGLQEGASDLTVVDNHLRRAVDGLREAGQQDYLPPGLLARAELYRVTEDFPNARRNLDEAMKIAARSGMKLHEADAHLEYARLHLAMGDKDKARASLGAGKAIVEETGYHRRDGAVQELEQQLGKEPPPAPPWQGGEKARLVPQAQPNSIDARSCGQVAAVRPATRTIGLIRRAWADRLSGDTPEIAVGVSSHTRDIARRRYLGRNRGSA